jgi:xanthine dehydrogenase iron-sulfur cluster and FAD-binding subunit A
LVYGNISGTFNHAAKTEDFLLGKCLNKMETLRSAMEILLNEVHPTSDPILASPEYRRHLTQALFYKVP